MVTRAYSETFKRTNPTYINTVTSEEWKLFSNFKSWMETQVWQYDGEKLELDKDLLVKDCQIYSKETCVFIPKFLNVLLNDCRLSRGELPIGVSYQKPSATMVNERTKPYYSYIRSGGKTVRFGYHADPLSAHRAWQQGKVDEIEKCIDRYSKLPYYNESVEIALQSRVEKLKQDYAFCVETIKL